MAKFMKLSLEGSRALTRWLCSDDTGVSSETIVRVLVLGMKPNHSYSHPSDNWDFGRCHRLLKAVPELRPHLHKMAKVSREWKELVKIWDELTDLHKKGKKEVHAIAVYRAMKTAIRKAEAAREKRAIASAAAKRAGADRHMGA